MTRDDIIRMAREAGLHSAVLLYLYEGREAALTDSERDELRRLQDFAARVAAAEREACAKVCELEAVASSLGHKSKALWQAEVAGSCSAAIRARGEE